MERLLELTNLLKQASAAYYNSETNIMTDKAFDDLYDELKTLETSLGLVLSGSPTQNAGYEVKSKLTKVTHSIPLKSLGKTKLIEDLEIFQEDQDCELMLKGDGLTDEIIYDGGVLIQGSTRGNGTIGEDITHNVKVFNRMPLNISFKGYLKIVGEAVIFDEDFLIVNERAGGKYSNSRNLVAGSVRQLDSKICADRNVNFMAFGILEMKLDGEDVNFKKFHEQLGFLEELGFYVVPHALVSKEEDLEVNINKMKIIAKEMGIPIDGMVLKINDISYGESLGSTSHHPLNAIAFKFYDEESETEYITTEWSTSRTGQLNPVAIFEPVDVSGSVIERATLHNVDYFYDLQLGKGDTITIIKANEVIPKVTGNLTRSHTENVPIECPVCQSKTEIRLLKTAHVLFCTNDDCPSKKIAQFEHFCSRDAMNILGVSEAILEKFIDKGFIKTIPDLYILEQYKDKIVGIDGFGEKSYNKIIDAIRASKQCKLENFIYALGIPNVGKGTSKDLANHFKTIDSFLDALSKKYFFSQIEDIGSITTESLWEWWAPTKTTEMICELLEHVEFKIEEKKEVNNNLPFSNMKIYCTGSFASHKKEELKTIVEKLGGEFASGYAKSLSMLVVGSLKGSSKVAKAEKDGVKVLSEEKFLEMIK
jgi:DNA ligase (NAD+)